MEKGSFKKKIIMGDFSSVLNGKEQSDDGIPI